MEARRDGSQLEEPISIYQIHLDSWMRVPEEGNRPLTPAATSLAQVRETGPIF